jgi:hypothetical protein
VGKRTLIELTNARDKLGGKATIDEAIEFLRQPAKSGPPVKWTNLRLADLYLDVECARARGMHVTDARRAIARFRKIGVDNVEKLHLLGTKCFVGFQATLDQSVQMRLRDDPALEKFLDECLRNPPN